MSWPLSFISRDDFYNHVWATVRQYDSKLLSVNIERFNKNVVDPIKLIFDNLVYRHSWDTTINNEVFRQRDKSNNNDIGYFHQKIFQYIANCEIPDKGWDVVFTPPHGLTISEAGHVNTVYVEMKNKHNTMNSASSAKTYMKMQNQILSDDKSACLLVEVIAKRSQDIKWEATVDSRKFSHKAIRRISIDRFYEIVTGQKNAFFKLCSVLPDVIREIVSKDLTINFPNDTVLQELEEKASEYGRVISNKDQAMAFAIYMLGFSSYYGFENLQS